MEQLSGQFKKAEVAVAGEADLQIAPRAVGLILLRPQGHKTSLRCLVAAGAGVHLLVPEISMEFNLNLEVGPGAHVTVSLPVFLSQPQTSHLRVNLLGEGANVHVQVAAVAGDGCQYSLNCVLDHLAPRTLGRLTVRRVLRGSAQSAFKGMLKVGEGAHGTDTYLSDKAVLMGEKAQATSDPQLEILADDVKASHGATIGRLNADELFYLRSRGIPQALAQSVLLEVFLQAALVGVPLALCQQFTYALRSRQ